MSGVVEFFVVGFCLLLGGNLIVTGMVEAFPFIGAKWKVGLTGLTHFATVLSFLILVGLSYCLVLGSAFDGMCTDTVEEEIVSPQGSHIAYITMRDCGAVTSSREMVPHIILRDSSNPVKFQGSEIAPESDWLGREEEDQIYVGDLADIRWLSDSHLQIQWDSAHFYAGDKRWNDVTISYVPLRRTKSLDSSKKENKSYATR